MIVKKLNSLQKMEGQVNGQYKILSLAKSYKINLQFTSPHFSILHIEGDFSFIALSCFFYMKYNLTFLDRSTTATKSAVSAGLCIYP